MKIDIREINATDAADCIQLLNMAEGLAARFCVMTDGPEEEEEEDGKDGETEGDPQAKIAEYQKEAMRLAFDKEDIKKEIKDLTHDLEATIEQNHEFADRIRELEKDQKFNLGQNGKLQGRVIALETEKRDLLARIQLLKEDKPPETVVKSPPKQPDVVAIANAKEPEQSPPQAPEPEPPAPPLEEAKARLGEPTEDPEAVEKKVKDIRKPKSKPRPERAKVSEAPGECLHCDLVSCTMKGWYCKDSMRALPVDAKKCKKFVEGVPDGEEEPSPPPAPPETPEPDPLEEAIKRTATENDPQGPQEPPQAPEPEVNTSAPVSPEPGTQAPPDPRKDPQTPPAPTPPPAPAADVESDPEAFIRAQAELPTDPEELRNMIRNEARLCIQNPAFKEPFKVVMKKYGAAITQIPEDKLPACVSELQAIRDAGGDPQGEIEF